MDVVRNARLRLKSFAYSGPRRDRWQQPDDVIAALAVKEGSRIADLGSGGGYFTFPLARAVGPQGVVYAVDTDADMSSLIRQTASANQVGNVITVAATPDDPMPPQTVDLVLTVNAFHHLPEPATYFATVAKYLNPDGRVAVIEAYPKWHVFGHATQPATIASTMADAGYTVAERHDFLRRQSFQIFVRRA
jgi:ubiquinone/menaquinone biosynthesis C-methylase UbiE